MSKLIVKFTLLENGKEIKVDEDMIDKIMPYPDTGDVEGSTVFLKNGQKFNVKGIPIDLIAMIHDMRE